MLAFGLSNDFTEDRGGLAGAAFAAVELIETRADPRADFRELIGMLAALKLAQRVPDYFAGIVVGACRDQIVDEAGELGG